MKQQAVLHVPSDTTPGRAAMAGSEIDARPVMSARLAALAVGGLVGFALLTMLAGTAGRMLGAHLASAGHSADTRLVDLTIGSDTLQLPANVIRFESQRQSGDHEGVDLYFLWPDLTGYSSETRDRFNDDTETAGLVFVSLSEQIMSKDMSGRYAPIYRQLIEGTAHDGPAGLAAFDLADSAGYRGERLFVEKGTAANPFVARCLGDAATDTPAMPHTIASTITGTSCQRDILIGEDIAVLYRFPSALLPQWQVLDTAIRNHLEAALVR